MSRRLPNLATKTIWLTLILSLFSISQMTTAKPSWKSDNTEESNTKGGGKGGKNRTSTSTQINIDSHPSSQTVTEGELVTFSVNATSADGEALNYQWYFNNNPITGATLANFEIMSTNSNDQGEYKVVLSNSSTSKHTSAQLTIEQQAVEPDPSITIDIQPVSQTINATETITLNVSASSAINLQYQWRKNGVNIPDAIHSHLDIPNASESDGGVYDVIISNTSESVASNSATLSVKPLADIALQWSQPTYREDGSLLDQSEINGYNIYLSYENEIEEVITVPGNYTQLTLDGMFSGLYQFAIATIDNSGLVGSKSEHLSISVN